MKRIEIINLNLPVLSLDKGKIYGCIFTEQPKGQNSDIPYLNYLKQAHEAGYKTVAYILITSIEQAYGQFCTLTGHCHRIIFTPLCYPFAKEISQKYLRSIFSPTPHFKAYLRIQIPPFINTRIVYKRLSPDVCKNFIHHLMANNTTTDIYLDKIFLRSIYSNCLYLPHNFHMLKA